MTPLLYDVGPIYHYQWNIDCSVGLAAQNNLPCDVSYIQWYYTLAAVNVLTPQDRRAIYSKVAITGACSGRADDPLVAAITAHQTALKHSTIDGKISVAKGTGKLGTDAYFVLRLGARLADMFPQAWPRLDLIPHCPPSVAETVLKCVPRIRK